MHYGLVEMSGWGKPNVRGHFLLYNNEKIYVRIHTRTRARIQAESCHLEVRQEHLKAAMPIIRPHISGGKSHRFTALRFVNRLHLLKGGSLSTELLSFRPSEAVSRARGEISERQRRTKAVRLIVENTMQRAQNCARCILMPFKLCQFKASSMAASSFSPLHLPWVVAEIIPSASTTIVMG